MRAVRAALVAAVERLRVAGVDSPEFDAAELAGLVLGVRRSEVGLAAVFSPEQAGVFRALVDQRADRVPLQHLTGVAGFRRLELRVGPGVFVPRPETELLVSAVLSGLSGVDGPVAVDLCAGSGAVALSIAQECPQANVYAVEVDPFAVAWARRNAELRAAAGDRPITVVEGDARDPVLLTELDGRVDALTCNPPYVPDGALVTPEVADHDPALALWGGPDGLDVVRGLLPVAARLLRPGGVLAIEHADRQGEAMPALLRHHGAWDDVADHRDLADRPRYTTAVRRS